VTRALAAVLVASAACSHPPPPQPPAPPPAQPPAHGGGDDSGPSGGPVAPPAGDGDAVGSGVVRFAPETLCVTSGSLRGAHVAESSMRAVVKGSSGDGGAVEFTYTGPTAKVSHLKSGMVREQIALKLRADDGCNLVYVAWRFGPKQPEIAVQVKLNPGQHESHECGNGGYQNVEPSRRASVERPAPGSKHVLEAAIHGDDLIARIDGNVAWEGALPGAARDLHGPLGVRTDNVEADLSLIGARGNTRDDTARCRQGGGD
jgi:hypothetical protein